MVIKNHRNENRTRAARTAGKHDASFKYHYNDSVSTFVRLMSAK
jgi:hypothetical protein